MRRIETLVWRCLILHLISVLICTRVGMAETITLGVRDMPRDLNVLSSDHVAAQILRAALTARLTTIDEQGQLVLGLADAVRVNATHSTWSFRVRYGARFQSGDLILATDVADSLEACRNLGQLPKVAAVRARTEQLAPEFRHEWVDLDVARDEAPELTAVVSRCPIVASKLARWFGQDLGLGTNIPSAGLYEVQAMKAGRQYELRRVLRDWAFRERSGDGVGADSLVVRSFQDPRHGLTALREGTIDALFSVDEAVLSQLSGDETIKVGKCLGEPVVYRRGFQLACGSGINVASLRYIKD